MKFMKAILAAASLTASAASLAGPITVDAGWYGFCFEGVGSPATSGCINDGIGMAGNPFTFVLSGPGVLKVTDAFEIGDVFDVWVNSVFAFTTSATGAGSTTSDPDLAFASGYYSAGSFALASGAYSVEVFANASPFNRGGAYLEVESTRDVPEPASLALFGLALAGLGLRRKRAA